MPTVRKYDEQQGVWEPIASNDAAGVYTNNAILTGSSEGDAKSVEDILLRDREDIDKLQRNVSWLALHGGGGSGGGGSNVTATIKILDPTDNETEITSLIWTTDIKSFAYSINSNIKTTFNITVKLGNRTIQTNTVTTKNDKIQINVQNINKYIGTGGTLTVTAMDPSETMFSASCRLTVSNIELRKPTTLRLTTDQLVYHESYPLTVNYRSNVPGNYRLYYCNTQIIVNSTTGAVTDINGQSLDGSGPGEEKYIRVSIQNYEYQVTQLDVVAVGLIPERAIPGGYGVNLLLLNEDDRSIRSSNVTTQVVVLVTDGILVVPQSGLKQDNPIMITKDSILPLTFTVYGGDNISGTFYYYVTVNGNMVVDTTRGESFNTLISVSINLNNFSFLEPGEVYAFEIHAGYGLLTDTKMSWVSVLSPTAKLLTAFLKDSRSINNTIFDYTFYSNIANITENIQTVESLDSGLTQKFTNNHYLYKNYNEYTPSLISNVKFHNVGIDSGSNSVYYKLRHTAYGVITTDSNNKANHWFPNSSLMQGDISAMIFSQTWQFSLEFAYHINEEVDDMATILNMGNLVVENGVITSGKGILVTAHNVYIKLEKASLSCVLQDNSFTQLDIVIEKATTNRWIRVYQNAKLLKTVRFETEPGSQSNTINEIILGCRSYNSTTGAVSDNINVDIYSIRMLSCSLNVGEIVCSYINNFANYNRNEYSQLPEELITSLCINNGIDISKDEDPELVADPSKISTIFNLAYDSDSTNPNSRDKYTWGISVDEGGNLRLPETLLKLPIPIVTLSFPTWEWDQFIGTNSSLSPDICSFAYYPNSDGQSTSQSRVITSEGVTTELQGTSSMTYTIKNLNITFPSDTLFSPKDSWFPEQTFTLKADVVDSGHVNNAAIGKFINDCFIDNPGGLLMNVDECFPTVNKVRELKNSGHLPESLTVKACIEGFPCLLIANFKGSVTGTRDPRILGIYSFNLGRESYYNQGYKVPNYLYKHNTVGSGPYTVVSDITFPNLFGVPPGNEIDKSSVGYCYEGTDTFNCDYVEKPWPTAGDIQCTFFKVYLGTENGIPVYEKYSALTNSGGYASIGGVILKDLNGNNIPWGPQNITLWDRVPNGYFWSNHESYAADGPLWKFVADTSVIDMMSAPRVAFNRLNSDVATKIPYTKCDKSQYDYGSSIPQYKIEASSTGAPISSPTGASFELISAQSDAESTLLSVKNTSFYYVVSLLFGLVDSLGKNLQMKYWSTNCNYWSPTFYDMDTALGLNNGGGETIKPTVLDYSIFNSQAGSAEMVAITDDNDEGEVYTIHTNKLFGIEDSRFERQYSQDFSVNSTIEGNSNAKYFAQMWNNLRTTKVLSADNLFEKYIENQLAGVGEILINYDFEVKYLETSQSNFLHGNRLSFIKNWLNKRITFLDSVFGYSQYSTGNDYSIINYLSSTNTIGSPTNIRYYNTPWNNVIKIYHNSGTLTIPVITNRSVIMRTLIGGNKLTYTYVPENVETNITIATSLNANTIQTTINNSDCIIDLPDLVSAKITSFEPVLVLNNILNDEGQERYPEDDTGNLKNQWGTLPSLKNLNLSGSRSFNSSIDFFRLFKTWDSTVLGIRPNTFALQTLDLSNMVTGGQLAANISGADAPPDPDLASVYRDPFTDFISLDVSRSDISQVSIPEGVSLLSLNLSNSQVSTVFLKGQPLLPNLSLTGCSALQSFTAINCDKFTNISFDTTNFSLSSVLISGCNNVESITIDAGSNGVYNHVPTITIQDCPKLKNISLLGLNRETMGDNKTFTLSGCENVERINLAGSNFTTMIWDKKGRVVELNLSQTSITTLKEDTQGQDGIVDLTFPEFNQRISDWDSSTTYSRGAIVKYDGAYYIVISDSTSSTIPPNDPTDWEEIEPERNYNYLNGINSFTIEQNSSVQFIRFNNIGTTSNYPTKAFRIKTTAAFRDCINLERVYGNVSIEAANVFLGCTKFSILGTDATYYLDPTVELVQMEEIEEDGETIEVVSYVRHFADLSPNEKNLILYDGYPRFQEGSEVTNMTFQSTNAGYATFQKTSCTILDAYYALYQFDLANTKPTTAASMFEQVSGITWSVYNSPNSHLFDHCSSLTSCSRIFYGTPGIKRLFSPSIQNGIVINDDGLFSPLINCTNINLSFSGGGCIIDKYLFRRQGDVQYQITNLDYFYATYIVDNARLYSSLETIQDMFTVSNIESDIASNTHRIGDLGGFFNNIGNVTTLRLFLPTAVFINYDLFKNENNSLGIPTNCSTIRESFISTYTSGTIENFDNIFAQNSYGEINVQYICASFINNTTTNSNIIARLELNDTLDNGNSPMSSGQAPGKGLLGRFVSLLEINNSDVTGDFRNLTGSFSGFKKIIKSQEGEYKFPYRILQNCPNKSNVTAFRSVFNGATFINSSIDEEYIPETIYPLPGNMFVGCSSLKQVPYLFYDLNIKYNLDFLDVNGEATENLRPPFTDCTKLEDVSYMFGVSADTSTASRRLNYLNGYIPNKLFYHGSTSNTVTLSGVLDEDSRIEESGVVINEAQTQATRQISDTVTYFPTGSTETSYERKEQVTVVEIYTGFELITGETTKINCIPTTIINTKTTTTITNWGETPQSTTTTTSSQYGNIHYSYYSSKIRTMSWEYPIVNTKITSIRGCFQGADIEEYHHYDYDVINERENLSSYQPYKYKYENGTWSGMIVNNKKYSLMWVYDGSYNNYTSALVDADVNPNEYEFLDDYDGVAEFGDMIYAPISNNSQFSELNTGYFCCAPDLLRYCATTATVSELFKLCGQIVSVGTAYNQLVSLLPDDCWRYGLHGRIVPYLLKPVPNLKSNLGDYTNAMGISEMFMGCKNLGWYTKNNQKYTIPESFLSYINTSQISMYRTFFAVHFPNKINLDVFRSTTITKKYNIREIFRYMAVDSNTTSRASIDSIFKSTKLYLVDIKGAFMCATSYVEASATSSTATRSQYITFGNNFLSNNYSRGSALSVYDGYSQSAVEFPDPSQRELPTDPANRNYRTV